MAKGLSKEEFEKAIVEVYDNFTKEQFESLLSNTQLTVINLLNSGRAKKITTNSNDLNIEFNDTMHSLAFEVWKTVHDSRRISFKQFKILSAFSKTNWLSDTAEKEEYKQF